MMAAIEGDAEGADVDDEDDDDDEEEDEDDEDKAVSKVKGDGLEDDNEEDWLRLGEVSEGDEDEEPSAFDEEPSAFDSEPEVEAGEGEEEEDEDDEAEMKECKRSFRRHYSGLTKPLLDSTDWICCSWRYVWRRTRII
jgi:hypothetical protein